MNPNGLGTHLVCQIGLIVKDIERSAQAYSEILGLPKPDVRITDTVDVAKTTYRGASTTARAMCARVCDRLIPLNAPRAVGLNAGVAVPEKCGRHVRPSAPGGTVVAASKTCS